MEAIGSEFCNIRWSFVDICEPAFAELIYCTPEVLSLSIWDLKTAAIVEKRLGMYLKTKILFYEISLTLE